MSISLHHVGLNIKKGAGAEQRLLTDISFAANMGDIIGITGRNGSGKTTLCKLLTGLIQPTTGQINVMGYVPYKLEKQFKKIVSLQLPHITPFWNNVDCYDSLLLHGLLYGIERTDVKARIAHIAEQLQIECLMKKEYGKCSLGEKTLLNFSSAVITHPKLLILDEPTIGLDTNAKILWKKLLLKYLNDFNPIVIITSHIQDDIDSLCHTVIALKEGRLIWEKGYIHDAANA